MLANTTEIGTATLPRRRLTIPAPTDVSPSAPRRPPRFPALAWPALALLVLLAALALLGLLAHPSPASAQTDVWTATLTPADFDSGILGCNNASATSKCSTATVLSDDDFTYDSTDYSVTTVFRNATAFTFTVDTDITAATNALTVVVGSTSLAFADATQTARTMTWFNPGFSWTAGTAVSIRIPDTTPPELTSAAVAADGNSITVTFDESVDQTNLPAAGAFSVAADGAPVTVSGVSAGTAAQLVLALAAPGIRAGQVVTLGYTDPTAGDDTSAVQDTSGNDAVSFSDYSVTNNSIVVAVPSNWSLKPTGLAAGAKFRLLFLSSTKRDGSSSDIADYNTFIQTRAAAGHADIRTYSTGFRALGCTADTDARDTTYTTYTSTDKGVPIYWLNGAKAADQYEDFYDGTWDDEVNDKNESGTNGPNTSLEANYPLTGCNDRGTEYFDRFNRSSALAKIEVMVGRPNSSAAASHGPLSSNTALDVSNTVTRPMYGLSAIFQVAADTTPPTLTSADVEETNGLTIYLEFSEDLQLSNPPLASAFTLTVDGSAVTGFSVALPGSLLPQNAIWLRPPTAIRQGQAVVVTYTDPTAGNDTAAIQDTTGNDAADFTTGMNSVPAVINNSTVANAVLAGWSLTPTGLAVGDQFRLLFLSSTKRDATATDIATYNTFIQTRAAAGHADIQAYSAGFRALGCTSDGRGTMRGGGVDARDNTETTYISTAKGVPIYWLNGAKAADEYEDFYDGSWDDEANDKNESGTDAHDTSQTANWPWTGCNHNGTELRRFAGAVSRGLGTTVGIPNEVRYGRPDSSTVDHGPLNGLQNGPKAENRPLYGLSALFQVAAAVVVNNPPAFSADTAARSVAENTAAGQNVGAALTATDDDGHTLTYTLEGADAASFDILSTSGQIQTKAGVTYNHEATSTYTVIVKADDSNGGTDTVTVTITVTDVNEPPGRPAAPSVTATAGSSTSLDVSWTAPTNTGPAIASYDLQYRAGTSGNFTNGPQNVTGTSAAIGSLAADTSYEVQVRATNAEGDGDWSVAGTGRTTATSAPGAPTGLTATASGATQINLSWSAPGSTGGSAITGYKIEVSPNGTSGWTDQVANTSNTTTTYAHTGLAAGTTRHYRVSAINANGAGTASNVDSATTGQTTVPPTLTSADVEETNGLSINLVFSEDLQLSNPPAVSAFTVTVDGSAATVSSVLVPGSVLPQNELWLQLSTAIRQRQAVVVTYTDATSGDDTAAIQDTAGNDAATFTTGMDGVPAVTNNSTVTKTVPADWSLKPTGLAAGDKFRLLFLSSTKRNASSTDIADYNTFIQTRAAAGHTDIQDYSADFRAVGCTADTDARDNTKTTYTTTDKGVPIYWLNGAKAADQYEDFYDGSWDDEANDKNESGTNGLDTSQNVNYPWTGCDHDGTEAVTGGDSFALGTGLVDARVGRPNSSESGHGPLNGQTNRSNFQNSPLYGLSEVFQVAAAVVVPNNPPTGAPTITGTAQVGQTLTAGTTAIMDADGLTSVSYTYQWIRTAGGVDTNISGATASTYTLVAADLGTTIKVTVSFTDDASNPETLTSAATAAVSAAPMTPAHCNPSDPLELWCAILTVGFDPIAAANLWLL